VTVRGWNPAQAHALERRAKSGQSQAHWGTLASPRLPYAAVIVAAFAVVDVVVVLVVNAWLTSVTIVVLVKSAVCVVDVVESVVVNVCVAPMLKTVA
jgi:hypothetical protein